MQNPFDTIDSRLSNIENILLDFKHPPKQTEQGEAEKYISIASTCLMLSVSRPTIYEYLKNGRLKKYKIGSTTRLLKSEVLSIVEQA
jgi:excisionase family DNA binding protein